MKKVRLLILAFFVLTVVGCAAPMKVQDVSFTPPEAIPGHLNVDGLMIAAVPIDSLERSNAIFHTDLKDAEVLPVQIIVRNTGKNEIEINHQQIYGITPYGDYQVAFTLDSAATNIRSSSIGRTAVAQTVAGAVVGTVVGVGIGAGIGAAAGDTGTGAQAGAIIGGTAGAASGLAKGMSDRWTFEFKKQLTIHAFEDRVIYPGDIQQGFIYLRWQPYSQLRIKLFDITKNTTHEVVFPFYVSR